MEGMIFGWLGAKMEHWIFKPVAMCLPCMASIWSIILLQRVDIKAMLIICGINAIIAAGLQFLETIKVPLLINNKRSFGGGALLDHCIVKIKEIKRSDRIIFILY